ncbi:MAG: cobalamin biosynthetic protein CobC [Paracoccaceae bacterium]|jgi:cobalamin biosynthetic protein CobC
MKQSPPDHGGGIDAAIQEFGGARGDWLDLSTGINPVSYPLPKLTQDDWAALPDAQAMACLLTAARKFWKVPPDADIIAAPGASAIIARIPYLLEPGAVDIQTRTYNEHAGAFMHAGWQVSNQHARAKVVVHPNNPDGALWQGQETHSDDHELLVIDESFCDIAPEKSFVSNHLTRNTIVLKSFGKFWGLAGVRLGFAIGHFDRIDGMRNMLGPWPVAGPALRIGATALGDLNWANSTRERLTRDANRLDKLMLVIPGVTQASGTSLFRLYDTKDATAFRTRLARAHILTRSFPYSKSWLRLGLPGSDTDWARLETALEVV